MYFLFPKPGVLCDLYLFNEFLHFLVNKVMLHAIYRTLYYTIIGCRDAWIMACRIQKIDSRSGMLVCELNNLSTNIKINVHSFIKQTSSNIVIFSFSRNVACMGMHGVVLYQNLINWEK